MTMTTTAGGSTDDSQGVVWLRTCCLTCPGIRYICLGFSPWNWVCQDTLLMYYYHLHDSNSAQEHNRGEQQWQMTTNTTITTSQPQPPPSSRIAISTHSSSRCFTYVLWYYFLLAYHHWLSLDFSIVIKKNLLIVLKKTVFLIWALSYKLFSYCTYCT